MKNEYDLLKVFAILLVVIGHITILYGGGSFGYLPANNVLTGITSAVYLFHMPLFVALSGAIFCLGCDHGKYSRFCPFLRNKVLRLIVPFIMTGIFFLAPALIFLHMTELPVFECIRSILLGGGLEKHLWFLPTLFWIFMIVWVLWKCGLSPEMMFLLSVSFAVVCSLFLSFKVLFIWDAIQYLPYFTFGMLANKNKNIANKKVLFTGIGASVILGTFTKVIDINWLDNICRIFLPCSIVMSLIAAARMITPFKGNSLLSWILKQSFPIYLFHIIAIFALYRLLGEFVPTAIMIPLAFLVAIFYSFCMAWICRKFGLQFIIGEREP